MLDDAPRERQAVERARATADFIQHDEAALRGIVQNVRRLGHFDHERGLAARQIIACTDAGEDAVNEINPRLRRRNEAAHVCEQRQQCDLPDVGGFARHVRPGDKRDLRERGGRHLAARNCARF